MLPHKDIVLPGVDLSHDEGDTRWHEAGGKSSIPAYKTDGTVLHYTWTGLGPGFYAEYFQICVERSWARIVADYEADPDDVHAAYYYLGGHPVFWKFDLDRRHRDYPDRHVSHLIHGDAWQRGLIEVTPFKICPETGAVETDAARNTVVRWWYEFGPVDLLPGDYDVHAVWHDWPLDGDAATFEQAVADIARKVHEHYGNDRRVVDSEGWRDGTHGQAAEEEAEDGTGYLPGVQGDGA